MKALLAALSFHIFMTFCIVASPTRSFSSSFHELVFNVSRHCPVRSCSYSLDSIPCYCDDMCEWYGDCCGDYNRSQINEQLHLDENFKTFPSRFFLECVPTCIEDTALCTRDSVPMITKCPIGNLSEMDDRNSAQNVVADCSSATNDFPPVTDSTTGIVYKNIFCALCNEISIWNVIGWDTEFNCDFPVLPSEPENDTVADVVFHCAPLYYHPPYLEHLFQRYCIPSLVTTCPNELVNRNPKFSSSDYDELVSRCATTGIDAVMFSLSISGPHYSNPYCAICNIGLEDIHNLSCYYGYKKQSDGTPMLLPFNRPSESETENDELNPVLKELPLPSAPESWIPMICANGTVYDPHLSRCRETFFALPSPGLDNDTNTAVNSTANCRTCSMNIDLCQGSYIALIETEYLWLMHGETLLWLSNNETYFIAGFHNVNDPIICVNLSRKYNTVAVSIDPRHQFAIDILSYIGLVLDIVSGIFILITYCSFKDLQTVYGKLLLNMVIITIASDVSLVMGYPISKIINSNSYCTAMSIVIHLVFLARFFSCSVLFCEATRTFYHALKIVPAKGKSRKQMCKYLCSYLIPVYALSGLIVLTCVALNFTLAGSIGYGYGVNLCWMSNRIAIGITFLAPLCLTLILNCYCFVFCSLVIIRMSHFTKAKRGNQQSSKSTTFRNFRVIVAFFSVSGISWISFILVLIPGSDGRRQVWGSYIFVILNSSQLLLVALAYVCTKKVLKKYSTSTANKAIQFSRIASVFSGKKHDIHLVEFRMNQAEA